MEKRESQSEESCIKRYQLPFELDEQGDYKVTMPNGETVIITKEEIASIPAQSIRIRKRNLYPIS